MKKEREREVYGEIEHRENAREEQLTEFNLRLIQNLLT